MRMSRVLLAGVAVAGAVATTSAFTNSNTFDATGALDDNAGYGELAVTGVTVSNVAYNPLASDASKLDSVVFTVAEDTTDMKALLTLTVAGSPAAAVTCGPWTATLITCDVPDTTPIKDVTKVGLTVVSK